MSEVTHILNAIEHGDPKAAEELLPLVYEELRRLAALRMAHEPSGHTLQATALVHEAWLRLVSSGDQTWQNRAQFFAAAAQAMRRVLIDIARRKQAVKHGGDHLRVELREIEDPTAASQESLLLVHEAVDKLALEDPASAELVKLRFFAGLSVEEAACILGVTDRTARRYWRFARAWLFDKLRPPA